MKSFLQNCVPAHLRKNLVFGASLCASLALVACGGGGSGSKDSPDNTVTPPPPPPPSTSERPGVSADGFKDDSQENGISFSRSGYVVSEAKGLARITVNRSGDLSAPASVRYTTFDDSAIGGTDYIDVSGLLTWAAGDGSARTFDIQVMTDADEESSESILIELSEFVNASPGDFSSVTLNLSDNRFACVKWDDYVIETAVTIPAGCYQLDRDLLVRNGGDLNLQPGVRLEFDEGDGLTVEPSGLLNASGSETNPVVLTAKRASPGYWEGLDIRSTAESIVDHTIIEYAGSGVDETNLELASDARLKLTNSILRFGAGSGAFFNRSAIVSKLEANTFTANESVPVRIATDVVGILNTTNTYTGNFDSAGESTDFIQLNWEDTVNDQTMNNIGLAYRSNFRGIAVNSVFTIQPGVVIKFQPGTDLSVEDSGILISSGTPEQPIIFTGEEAIPGYWEGIEVYSSLANILANTVIEYAGSEGGYGEAGIYFNTYEGAATLSNVLLQFNERDGFAVGHDTSVTMDGITSVGNGRSGRVSISELNSIAKNGLYTGNSDDRILLLGATIDSPQTLKRVDVGYRLGSAGGTVSVKSDFTIEPGVTIEMGANQGFRVDSDGSLSAIGTPEAPITFTGSLKEKGHWRGIQYSFASTQRNRIDYAVVEYGGADGLNFDAMVGYFGINSAGGSITNSIFRHSLGDGIELDGSIVASGNVFEDIDGQNIVDFR